MKRIRGINQELLEFLESVVRLPLQLRSYGPAARRIFIAEASDYPRSGLTTFVTLGNSRLPVSIYRGLDVGFELTMTLSRADTMLVDTLANGVLGNLLADSKGARRTHIEYNGVYAPGYPPHVFFTEEVTCTPKIAGRKRIGDAWVTFLAAVPLDDSELREHDRDVSRLIKNLRKSKQIAEYPRRH